MEDTCWVSLFFHTQPLKSGEMDGLELLVLSRVVQLVVQVDDLLQLSDLPVSFMADERAVEVGGENNKDQAKWHHDAGGSDGRRLAGGDGAIICLLVVLERQKLHPAEEHHLRQEEERANYGGKSPG